MKREALMHESNLLLEIQYFLFQVFRSTTSLSHSSCIGCQDGQQDDEITITYIAECDRP